MGMSCPPAMVLLIRKAFSQDTHPTTGQLRGTLTLRPDGVLRLLPVARGHSYPPAAPRARHMDLLTISVAQRGEV